MSQLCKCGCGETATFNCQYVTGHRVGYRRVSVRKPTRIEFIRPVGMTFERALEIAVQSRRKTGRPTS